MSNASVFQVAQWGVESTHGINVAANKKLPALSISFQPTGGEAEVFRPDGYKFATGSTPAADEMTILAIEGKLDYNNVVYLLASLLNYAAPVQQGATIAYKWTFTPDTDAGDTYKSYSIEKGSTVTAAEVSWGTITAITLTFNRKGITLSAEGFATALSDGISMTGSPTEVAAEWVLPIDVDVYLADTQAGLAGASALTTLKEVEWHLTGKYQTDWNLNSAQTSFNEVVEVAPDHGGQFVLTKDATATALRTVARSGNRKWLRIKAVGELIASTYYYTFLLDVPIEFTSPGEEADQDGVYAMTFPFVCVHDATWGKTLDLQVTNIVSAL